VLLKRLAIKDTTEKSDLLSPTNENGTSINTFTQFLKAKIDKKRDESQLRKFAQLMDIDKDGLVSEIDLQTCLSHLNSDSFFRNNGEALTNAGFSSSIKFYPGSQDTSNKQYQPLSEERAFEVLNQIRTALVS
jgi:Ca2+-binding EF-hand superfamily protein